MRQDTDTPLPPDNRVCLPNPICMVDTDRLVVVSADWASWAAGLTPAQGALPLLYAAAAPDVEGQPILPSDPANFCPAVAPYPRFAWHGPRLLVALRVYMGMTPHAAVDRSPSE